MKYPLLLSILFFVSCNFISTKYPRVVKNGCGTYAVQMSNQGNYIGVIVYRPHYECYGDTMYASNGLTISGGGFTFLSLSDCGYDTTNIEIVKVKKHQKIWADIKDTSYQYRLGTELQFKTEVEATAAMNSYLRRTDEYNKFADSITLCHTYK